MTTKVTTMTDEDKPLPGPGASTMSAPADAREQAQPNTLTADEAIARLNTWFEDPGEDLTGEVIESAQRWARSGEPDAWAEDLRKAVDAYDAAQVVTLEETAAAIATLTHPPIRSVRLAISETDLPAETSSSDAIRELWRRLQEAELDAKVRGPGGWLRRLVTWLRVGEIEPKRQAASGAVQEEHGAEYFDDIARTVDEIVRLSEDEPVPDTFVIPEGRVADEARRLAGAGPEQGARIDVETLAEACVNAADGEDGEASP